MYIYIVGEHVHMYCGECACTCRISFFLLSVSPLLFPFVFLFLSFSSLPLSLSPLSLCLSVSLSCSPSLSPLRLFLESESERSVPAAPNSDLRLHYATLISSLINSFPEGSSRARLLPSDMRRDMFFMIAGWAGGFWHQSTDEQDNK